MDVVRLFTSLIAAHRQQQQTLALQGEIQAAILAQLLELEDVKSRSQPTREVIEDAEAHLVLLEEALPSYKRSNLKYRLAGLLGEESLRSEEPDYEVLKAGLLDHAREADIQLEQDFNSVRFDPQKGPRELGQGLELAARRWLRPDRRTAMEVVRCVALQRFVTLLPEDVGAHVLKLHPQDMEQAVCMAERHAHGLTEDKESSVIDSHSRPMGCPAKHPDEEEECGGADHLTFDPMNGGHQGRRVEGGVVKEEVHPDEDQLLEEEVGGEEMFNDGFYCERAQASGTVDGAERFRLRNMPNMAATSEMTGGDVSAPEEGETASLTPSYLQSSTQPHPDSDTNYIRANHSQRHNCRAFKMFCCLDCDHIFESQKDLTQHRRSHAKTHCCPECGKSFRDRFNLKCHMRTHTGERPHTCHYCGKHFAQEHGLLQHVNIHTGERPFCCTVCGMGFHHSRTLKKHVVLHSQDRPFLCPHCGVTFKLNDTLKRHLRTDRKSVV